MASLQAIRNMNSKAGAEYYRSLSAAERRKHRIRNCAYDIYRKRLSEGREGNAESDWLEAEKERAEKDTEILIWLTLRRIAAKVILVPVGEVHDETSIPLLFKQEIIDQLMEQLNLSRIPNIMKANTLGDFTDAVYRVYLDRSYPS